MKQINVYINEKLIIHKDMDQQRDPNDPSTWQEGDILCGTWSWTMCLPEWYVIKKRTPKMFTIQEIPGKIVSGHKNGQWEEIANINAKPEGKEIRVKINSNGEVWNKRVHLTLWDGKTPLHGDDMD